RAERRLRLEDGRIHDDTEPAGERPPGRHSALPDTPSTELPLGLPTEPGARTGTIVIRLDEQGAPAGEAGPAAAHDEAEVDTEPPGARPGSPQPDPAASLPGRLGEGPDRLAPGPVEPPARAEAADEGRTGGERR
ncbi:MAG: hypothetical protein Q4E05_09480, partial [Pseudoclavibacter sp.]|nr:hypothetical protein [Pseudoclavibacter sp.]